MQLQGDTPMHRMTILEMTPEQLDAHVHNMRARRMAAQKAYEEARAAKERLQHDKDVASLVKRLEQLDKVFMGLDKSFDKVDKYITDIKVLRLSLGDKL